jgi:hypothetical protein
LVAEPEEKSPVGRARRRWENNTRIKKGKGEVVSVPFLLSKHHAMKAY